MELREFDKLEEEQLYRIVRNLANKGGTGEGITVEVMKMVLGIASKKIYQMINKFLREGVFPGQ